MTILFGCGLLAHAAGAEVDVLFLRDHAVLLHEHQGHFLELGIDAVAMFEFDRVAVYHMAITADHFDKLLEHITHSTVTALRQRAVPIRVLPTF
jgi:hypothetical protein